MDLKLNHIMRKMSPEITIVNVAELQSCRRILFWTNGSGVSKEICSLYPPTDVPPSPGLPEGQRSPPAERREDTEMTSWLRLYGADQDSVDRVSRCFHSGARPE